MADELQPEQFGAIGDGSPHPLSERYGSLEAAQAVYPHASALTDEIDWCAWRAAVQFIYDAALSQSTAIGQNLAHGKIKAGGQYVFNRTLPIDVIKIEIEGRVAPRTPETSAGKSSWIKYNGPDGTAETPVYIFDCLSMTELGAAPAGRLAQPRGIAPRIRRLGFFGKGGDMRGPPSASGYVVAIRIRKASFALVKDCSFGGTLYDGVVFTGPQLFPTIKGNFFYGVHRDAISNHAYSGDFSTTIWITDNEFGYVGRYPILLDLFGSIEAMPVIRRNSFEHAFDSYYVVNRGWFVHGAVAGMCVIGGGIMSFADNRFEGVTGGTAGFIADVHLVECTGANLSDSAFKHLLVTTDKGSQPRSAAFLSNLSANGTSDITDARNHLCGSIGDHHAQTYNLHLRNLYNLNNVITAGGAGLGLSGPHIIEGTSAASYSLPVVGDMIDPAGAQTKTYLQTGVGVASYLNSRSNSVIDAATLAEPMQMEEHSFRSPSLSVKTNARDGVSEIQFFDEMWFRWANYGNKWDGYRGWTINRLAGDMSQAQSNAVDTPLFYAMPHNSAGVPFDTGYYECAVIRRRKIRYEYTAPPSGGTWTRGDIVYHKNPSAGGFIGWVCTESGAPGTWKTFGAISE